MSRGLRHLSRLLSGALVFSVACLPSSALAQSKPTTTQTSAAEPMTEAQASAQQHFQRAKELYQTGAYREAVAELEQARALDPKAKDLVFNLGVVTEKLGKYDDAVAYFRQYMEMDSVTPAERAKAETIVKRLEGAKREVVPQESTPAAKTPEQSSPQTTTTDPRPVEHGRFDTATKVAGAIAIVGLGVGIGFGIRAIALDPKNFTTGKDGTYDDLKTRTDDAHTSAIVSDVGLGVGVVAALATAWLYFGRTKEPKHTTTPSASLVPGGAVMLLGGSFQ
ncbi:TonB-dependent receptor [Labilithrix luteola]|uniref:TonB-dependent receptor n=1 Tax=Labilithrix luteola TaxID=1391654 RepID=A0A0K1QAK8_9BACT|nr:tetratricopeptide repeat protein [Labilithrix luteola]AKV02769.1 TonB-dependent receptor [Labilithrix luteola]